MVPRKKTPFFLKTPAVRNASITQYDIDIYRDLHILSYELTRPLVIVDVRLRVSDFC